MNIQKTPFVCATYAALSLAATAHGQNVAAPGAAMDAGPGLQEIVVTAQKRSEPANKIGMSITAVTSDTVERRNIVDPQELVTVVPGLSFTEAPRGGPVFAIRGVGFDDSTLGSASTVALYVDESPISYPIEARFPTLDLERIEVLKGPQGILYGQNSTAGAINFIAAKSTEHLAIGGDASYSRFNTVDVRGFVSGPVTDTLRMRIAVMGIHSGDWQYSYTRNDFLGAKRQFAGRVITEWEPSSVLKISLNLNGWIDKSDTQAGQLQNVLPVTPGVSQASQPGWVYPNYPHAPQNSRAADWDINPQYPLRHDDNYLQATLRGDFHINDYLTATSITALQRFNQDFTLDTDGSDLQDFLIVDQGWVHSFNQELRLTGDLQNLKFIVGANYAHDEVHEQQIYKYRESSAYYGFPFVPIYIGPYSSGAHLDQPIRDYAAFGNIDYSFNSVITAHAGARYTRDKRHYAGCTSDAGDGVSAAFYNVLYPLITGNPYHLVPGQCTSETNFVPTLAQYSLDEHNVSWRTGLDFQVTPTMLLYANVSKGYKSGGFPAVNAIANVQLSGVTQESVLEYEGGIKAGLFDRRMQINAAAFYNDYTDKQLHGRILDPFGILGVLEKLLNVPKSRVMGGEIDIQAVPAAGLNLEFSATYTDSKVTKDFFAYDPVGNLFNYKGLAFPHTPKWNLLASANYERPITSALNGFGGVNVTYHSKTMSLFADPALVAQTPLDPTSRPGVNVPGNSFDEKGYTLVDLQLGIAQPDGKWRAWLWGKNLLDTYYWTNATQGLDSIYRLAAMPATYGASVSVRF
ncbi:MAG: TonB-dependent receptor [Steroidobacteraceae bacterium]